MLRSFLAAAMLLLPASAFAMEDPGFSIDAYCAESSAYVRSPSLESFCLQRETDAKGRVLELLPDPKRLSLCLDEAEQKGGSYFLLEECLKREQLPAAE